jgi:hypothetical protein
MALFTFWYGDYYVTPQNINNLLIQREFDISTLTSLMNLKEEIIEARLQGGNEAWVVRFQDEPVAFGWLSRKKARIGELSKDIEIPKANAYLWNFRTLEPYRGRGYYVELLRTILNAEEIISERLWIISAPENQSSFNGIVKAGFQPVGDIMFDYKNEVVLLTNSVTERTQAGAELLQLPITTSAVRPCWRCVSKAMNKEALCDCFENNLPCRCNNQNKLKASPAII